MIRKALCIAIVTLVVTGTWQLSHGLWIHVKAHLAQHLLQRAWGRTRAGERDVKPWPWADTWPVARLTVPAHGVDLIVLAGASGRTLAFGPGHADGSPEPGAAGAAGVTGHPATHVAFLRRGRAGGRPAVLRVREATVVDARTAVVASDDAVSALVLLTCYPFDAVMAGGPLRYVVTAERADG